MVIPVAIPRFLSKYIPIIITDGRYVQPIAIPINIFIFPFKFEKFHKNKLINLQQIQREP